MTGPTHDETEALNRLNRLLVEALRRLADEGHTDEACRIAGRGWSVLRHVAPHEAERINGALHYMTGATARAQKIVRRFVRVG